MHVQFVGAAQTVTGSMHVLDTGRTRVLVDCGQFQGRRADANRINSHLKFDPSGIDAMVLTHAHIDHSGLLPVLARDGFRGKIYSTPATCDLLDPMLHDAAHIQKSDADYMNRRSRRHGWDDEPIVPLYSEDDVDRSLGTREPVPYRKTVRLSDDVQLTLFDAGHVLGSAVCVLDIDAKPDAKRIAFSGDLGRMNAPILEDPEIVTAPDLLVMESTYGDRLHEPIHDMDERLASLIETTLAQGGKVLIPSFALERAQEILHAITRLQKSGRLKPIPIVVDSPLTVKLTQIFSRHAECFDAETRELLRGKQSPFEPANLRYIESTDDSRKVSESADPCVIISASGMLEAGRVLHHLRAIIDDSKSVVAIVGFQAQHTLGRRLLEGRDRVKIFGMEYVRSVRVMQFAGFSAHGDQHDLLAYADGVRQRGGLKQIALVHGEPEAQKVLMAKLKQAGHDQVIAPHTMQILELG